MGNRLFQSDMIINDFLRPYTNAYGFQQYATAAQLLYQLNSFLIMFDAGVDNLEFPQLPDESPTTVINANLYYQTYCEVNGPMVIGSVGKYLKQTLDYIVEENNSMI